MQEGKTIGQLMEEMRQKAGAQNYHGHDYIGCISLLIVGGLIMIRKEIK